MSYIYGCDVIKCSRGVMLTDCDVIHRVCVMSYRESVWYNWCTGLDDTDRVDVVSDIEEWFQETMHVMSYKMWCDFIKYGCDALYRLYDIVHIVGVMSYLERVWYHRMRGSYDTDTVAVTLYTMDMMPWFITEVISEIQLVWYHQYSACDDTDTVDMMSNIVGVMT